MNLNALGLSPEELAFEELIKDLPVEERVRRRSILTEENIANALEIISKQVEEKSSITSNSLELARTVELDPRLKIYKDNYECWDEVSKSKISWAFVQQRFLANNCYYLNKAEEMDRPFLFGADLNGNPLLANADVGPIMRGLDYEESRKIVFEEGYELFAYNDPFAKSYEILLFEEFTGHPIVKSGSIWLESGTTKKTHCKSDILIVEENGYNGIQISGEWFANQKAGLDPNRPRVASCYGKDTTAAISSVNPAQTSQSRGVRVFLRMLA